MSEITLDAYMQKIIDIETASTDINTSTTELQTLINDLASLDATLDVEIDAMVEMPIDFRYMRKIILVEIERARKANLQKALETLVNTRRNYIPTLINSDPDGNNLAIQYDIETESVKDLVKNVISGCNCMSNRKFLIEQITNGNNGNAKGNNVR